MNNSKLAVVSRDLVRDRLSNGEYSKGNWDFSKKNEAEVTHIHDKDILDYLAIGYDVIVDNTHLSDRSVRQLEQVVRRHDPMFVNLVRKEFFDTPVDECIRRDKERKRKGLRSVGEHVIIRMWTENVLPRISKPVRNPRLRNCVICDLDGTLAELNGRNAYDASNCDDTDTPNAAVLDLLKLHHSAGAVVIFTSGREDKYFGPTIRFLNSCGFSPDLNCLLYMRLSGDMRPDDVVKQEIYDTFIKGKYNVLCVVDDRPKVVRMWKSNGLHVFNVGHGVEF